MTPQPPSTPSQRCSPPSLVSWQRSELDDLVASLDSVDQVLRRIVLTEGERPSGLLARGARDAAQHALEHVHDLIRLVSRPSGP